MNAATLTDLKIRCDGGRSIAPPRLEHVQRDGRTFAAVERDVPDNHRGYGHVATVERMRSGSVEMEVNQLAVADPAFAETAVKATLDAFGRLDVLVPNAAFQEHVNALEDLTFEHFDRTLKTNLYGYFNMTKAAVPHMKAGGAIVMTGSVTGLQGNKDLLDYSLTKGGIHAYARSLGTHLAPRGIRVNVVAPGPVWTPLNPADKDADKTSKFGSQTVMKRPAQPEEIAPAYVFLASPQLSSFITGEILPIIGGY